MSYYVIIQFDFGTSLKLGVGVSCVVQVNSKLPGSRLMFARMRSIPLEQTPFDSRYVS